MPEKTKEEVLIQLRRKGLIIRKLKLIRYSMGENRLVDFDDYICEDFDKLIKNLNEEFVHDVYHGYLEKFDLVDDPGLKSLERI